MRLYQKYFPGNYDELITYYPKFYRDVLEMRAILEAHGAVLDELEDNIELVFFNNFIDTADEQTISDLEKFLDIKLNRSRSLEVRRRFVKSFFVHGNQFPEITFNRLDGSSKLSNMMCESGFFKRSFSLNSLTKLMASFLRILRFRWTWSSSTRQLSSSNCTSKIQCILSTLHSIRER